MTQEERNLLIRDLCARLPYNCMVSIAEGGIDGIQWADVTLNSYLLYQIEEENAWEYVKPYLRRMSSMTKEEMDEYAEIGSKIGFPYKQFPKLTDWLNQHHFDYRGLINDSLALEAPDGMYNH